MDYEKVLNRRHFQLKRHVKIFMSDASEILKNRKIEVSFV